MNENSACSYNDTKKELKELLEFIKLSGIKNIIFHQFEFLIMYFPVYMIIYDLMEMNLGINIGFKSYESDKAIIKYMANESFESFELDNEENTLQIGLCEPVVFNDKKHARGITIPGYEDLDKNELKGKLTNKCLGKKLKKDSEKDKVSYFIHLPFINFPPIYGVSLTKNKPIRKLKKEKMEEGVLKDHVWLRITDYWKHFSAKLSLLDKVDFQLLAASSYPDGSTTDWFIRNEIKFPLKRTDSIEHLKEEFKALFSNRVDVAFTVQPWVAISDSVYRGYPYKIDIVYKDVCKRFDCTSLILKTNKNEYLILGDYILNCFNTLLEKKIGELYKMDSSVLEVNIGNYCKILGKYVEISSLDKGFRFESKMALRLNIDSQIYRHLEEIKKEAREMSEGAIYIRYLCEKHGHHLNEILQYL